MENNLNILNNNNENDIERLKQYLVKGDVLLFFGAGYSKNAKNIRGKKLPLASDLSKEIGLEVFNYLSSNGVSSESILELKNCSDLKKTSSLFMKVVPQKIRLVNLLKENFTVKELTDSQKNILSIDWIKIYTTNYDDLIEKSLTSMEKVYTSINCDDIPVDYKDSENICFHINGDILKIKESDLDSKIKLTESSYLDSNQFSNSVWFREFRKDLLNSKCILFVGYSLYDIDVKKLLIDNANYLSDKTFFITRENGSIIDNIELNSYGSVLPIGIDGLSKLIDEVHELKEKEDKVTHEIKTLDLYLHSNDNDDELDEKEVFSSLLFGVNNDSFFDKIALSIIKDKSNEITKFINRKEIIDISNKIRAGRDILIVSDLGNGKSFLLKTIRSILSFNEYNCYSLIDYNGDLSLDLDEINKKNKNIIFIDDYYNYIDSLKIILEKSLPNIQIVLTSRNYEYEQSKPILAELDFGNLQSFNVNKLTDYEVIDFDDIISYLGLWKDKAGLTLSKKLSEIDFNSRDKLSSLLLHILKSKNIKDKLTIILDDLKKDHQNYDTLFSILLLSVLNYKNSKKNIISDVAMNDRIYERTFLEDANVNTLINVKNSNVEDISSSLAKHLIQEHYNKIYVKDKLLSIISHLYLIYKDTKEKNINEIMKKILRFSSLERLLPNKRNEIKDFYKQAKEKLPFLQKNPHFWVQYAMASIPFKEYNVAEGYLDNALGLASSFDNYHTRDIDTQRGRLYLLFCIDDESETIKKNKTNFEYFKCANEIFESIRYEYQKLRPLLNYSKVYNIRYKEFKKSEKVYFERAVNKIIFDIQDDDLFMDDFGRIDYKYVYQARSVFDDIQSDILSKRKSKK
ncbi:SIR2 family protein [Proteus vulgaris]|nr:SIR2 family protein [Proteus vulgaris]